MRRARGSKYDEDDDSQLQPNFSVVDIEEENEQMTDELENKIQALKSLSIDIGIEMKDQDKLLRGMDDDLDHVHGSLGSALKRVLKLSKGGHNYNLMYLIFFCTFVLIILWMIIKIR